MWFIGFPSLSGVVFMILSMGFLEISPSEEVTDTNDKLIMSNLNPQDRDQGTKQPVVGQAFHASVLAIRFPTGFID